MKILSLNKLNFFSFSKVRKAKTYIPEHYGAIPQYMNINKRDPFEYKLRSKEEIMKEQELSPPDFPMTVIARQYSDASGSTTREDMNRKVSIEYNMLDMKLSPLQKQRLIHLLGPRYKNSDIFQLSSDMYPTWEENLVKALEISREIYWETKRAP